MGAERESRRPDVFVGEFNPSYELVWLVVAVSNCPKLKFHSFCESLLLHKIDYIDTIYSFIDRTDLPPLPPVPPVEKVLIHHPTTSPLLNILCNVYSFLVY